VYLDQDQIEFLDRRRRLLRAWRYVGPLTLLGWLGLLAYLGANSPLLVDPRTVASRIDSGAIQQSTLETMATLLPVMSVIVGVLMVAIVALIYVALSHERRYLEIIADMAHRRSG